MNRKAICLPLQRLGWNVRSLSTGLPTFYVDKFFTFGACDQRTPSPKANEKTRKKRLKPSTSKPPRLPAIAPAKPHPAYRASAGEESRSTSSHPVPRAPSTSHRDHESRYPTWGSENSTGTATPAGVD